MQTSNSNRIDGRGELVEIDFAKEFKEDIRNSKILEFKDKELKGKIEKSDDNQLLVVTSTITSPKTIQEVEFYDKSFIEKNL